MVYTREFGIWRYVRRQETQHMTMLNEQVPLEQAFKQAYNERYGTPVKEFRTLDSGLYCINGIQFSEQQVSMMLSTLQQELVKKNQGIVRRLIGFFSGRR